MEGGDAWCMLKCAGGAQDKTIVNRIMLRFRPIAPKPVNGDPVSGNSTFGNKNSGVTSNRVKRKYVRVCEKNSRRIRKEDNGENKGSMTLQLMPESVYIENSMVIDRSSGADRDLDRKDPPSPCLKLERRVAADHDVIGLSEQTAALITSPGRSVTASESWVTVESVTDTCIDGGGMTNSTVVERMKNLEEDPCFVSDGWNRVLWVNEAYKKMVGVVDGAEPAVGLVVKEGFEFPRGAFSCLVGLQYGNAKGKKKQSKMVPSDVWEMNPGGFAWRLDIKAALSLGL
ncbi:Detected protein of unknown function [Hibiscus syriacus]|uniref:DUF7950 domain-containing protein n=1 Tax=Hibiscus syriacus TaxID=106335 RepID=A0A6A2ZZV4_HIBSY|nr:uncharacterized protein LOC120136484 isoform X2 [Hibiscus syriacus]KAE8697106.1 Detected protein of unknown function [Hibiscus syriacus]